MTIRSGGRARDPRSQPARPYVEDAYATESMPPAYEPARRGGSGGGGYDGGGGRGGGAMGVLRFLIFAVILAGIVLVVSLTALRPLINGAIVGWAGDNPAALRFPFVADIVREDLGTRLTDPASTDTTQVPFTVQQGDTAATIAARLEDDGFLADRRAFVFLATEQGLTDKLQQGDFILRKSLTPDQLVKALLAPPKDPFVTIELRAGLRLEQITAKLQTLPLEMDPKDFYDLVKEPPQALIDDYPWLKKIREDAPKNASLEGFLWGGTYRVLPDTQPEELVRQMLDRFIDQVGQSRIDVPADRGLNFYQILSLASIVQKEAQLDSDRPLIAGVYQNRIDGIPGVANRQLNADPTVFYAVDTMELAKLDFDRWKEYAFWTPPGGLLRDIEVTPELEGFQTYVSVGLIPGPIATPTVASIDAALDPDTKDKYIYFVAIPDGNGAHAFAKTSKEFNKLLKEYGYE
jgi:UPF0755 protein